MAQRLIAKFDGLRGLGRASYGELAGEKAMGGAKACSARRHRIGKRIMHAEPEHRRIIKVPEDVHAMLFGEMALLEQEHLRVILLTVRNEVICVRDIYKGNVSSAVVRIGEVFRDAVREGCRTSSPCTTTPPATPRPALRTPPSQSKWSKRASSSESKWWTTS